MKKIFYLSLALFLIAGITGCNLFFGKEEVESVKSSDGYFSVTPTAEGFLIEKKHPVSWEHNTIHVIQVENGQENARISNLDQYTNKVLYPYVKAGVKYRIHIEKQEANWSNWGETDKIEVTAIGGSGNYYVRYDSLKYNPEQKSIVFNKLTFVHPETVSPNTYFSGPLFNGTVWGSGVKNTYDVSYKLENSTLFINDRSNFLDGQDKIGIALSYEFSDYNSVAGKNLQYSCPVISSVIYNANFVEEVPVELTGGVEIPRVDISTTNGRPQGSSSHHFGDNWQEARIKITKGTTVVFDEVSCKLKDRGNSTKGTGKVPWSLKLDEKASILGMPKHKRWVLMANYYDRSLIRTQFASFMGKNVFNSYWNASFTPVNVYINGKFMGTYDLGECNKINKNRINVQSLEDFADGSSDFKDVNKDGVIDINDAGFMVEIDTAINWDGAINSSNYKTKIGIGSGAERIYFYSSEKCIPMTLKEPDFGDFKYSDEQCKEYGSYAKSKIDAFEKMLYSDDFASKYNQYIDVDSFIDWYLVNEFSKNSDANFQKSVPVTYNAATGKLYMGPNWDFDLSLGNFNNSYESIFGGSSDEDPSGWYIYEGRKWCDENALYCDVNNTKYVQSWWINRLMKDSEFKKAAKKRWNERKDLLKEGIDKTILEYANRVYDYIPANEENLPRLGVYEWNGPSGYENRKTYESEISYLLTWCQSRYNWMDKEINKW